ncbi:hypothetical protein BDC45DRAFT_498132 [Circinella umbellata]|nr:hypothetical protein BDC45DRAFT_498132 [Circinella umbellata]
MRCWILVIFAALSTHVRSLPTTINPESFDTTIPITSTTNNDELFSVDVGRYAQLLSTHLLFDHLDNAFYMLSKKISLQFRNSIQVNVNLTPQSQQEKQTQESDLSSLSSPVDVQILKGQLKGAVGSFIEDKFPAVWSRHAVALGRASLQSYIEHVVYKLCPEQQQKQEQEQNQQQNSFSNNNANDNDMSSTNNIPTSTTVSNICLESHAQQFLSSIDRYLGNHVKRTMADIVSYELPVLFDTTRIQVQDIVKHFNQQVLSEQDDHLELVLEADHTEWWVPAEVNEVLETVVHWQTPNNEILEQRQDGQDGNTNNSDNDNSNDNGSISKDPSTMFFAVHHFASLARVSPEQI